MLFNHCSASSFKPNIRMKSIVPVSYVPIKKFPYVIYKKDDDFVYAHKSCFEETYEV